MRYSDKIMNWLFLGSIGLACIFAIILLVATLAWSEEKKMVNMKCSPGGMDVASNGGNVPKFMTCNLSGQKGIIHIYVRKMEISLGHKEKFKPAVVPDTFMPEEKS